MFLFDARHKKKKKKMKKMCNQAVNTYAHALEFVFDCYKALEKWVIKLLIYVIYNPFAIQFVIACYKTKEICDEAVDTCPCVFDSVPD